MRLFPTAAQISTKNGSLDKFITSQEASMSDSIWREQCGSMT